MESGDSQNDAPNVPPPPTGALTEAERRALRERAEQARVSAGEAIARYAELVAEARLQIAKVERTLVAIDATREVIHQSVLRYARLMKRLEISPERTLRLVKETVAERLRSSDRGVETDALMSHVVTWCIEAHYYDSSPAA